MGSTKKRWLLIVVIPLIAVLTSGIISELAIRRKNHCESGKKHRNSRNYGSRYRSGFSLRRSECEYAIQAKEQLEKVGAKIIGTVLNKVEMKTKEHYYYYYYGDHKFHQVNA